jgi:hypothetical protein
MRAPREPIDVPRSLRSGVRAMKSCTNPAVYVNSSSDTGIQNQEGGVQVTFMVTTSRRPRACNCTAVLTPLQ